MSDIPQTQLGLERPVNLSQAPLEPGLWFQELRLLRRLSSSAEAHIRTITFRAGLNILWSPPEDAETESVLYREAWGGHAAGKTLFCRILRYLLGDKNYCTEAVLSSIRQAFPELWAVARIRVSGKPWLIVRSLVDDKDCFAIPRGDLESVLQEKSLFGDMVEFLQEVEALAATSLKDLYPEDGWRHLLPWLARDQEARYARVTAWRDSLSEADNPSTSKSKQHELMRAVFNLLEPEEHKLQAAIEAREDAVKRTQPWLDQLTAIEQRERELLIKDAVEALGPTANLENLSTLSSILKTHRELREEGVAMLSKEPETEAVRAARIEYEKATNNKVVVQLKAIEEARRSEDYNKQGNDLLGNVTVLKLEAVRNDERAAVGWCPNKLTWAQKYCGVPENAPLDEETVSIIEKMQQQGKQLLEMGAEAKIASDRNYKQAKHFETVEADALKAYKKETQESRSVASKLEKTITLLVQCEKRLKDYQKTEQNLAIAQKQNDLNQSQQDEARKKVTELRKDAEGRLTYMNYVFADIIKAVVGSSVDAYLKIDGNGLQLHATKQGELSGAALETVKTLAFDLAGLVAGVEGECNHPRFLIHDGPREADLSQVIYGKIFIYVVDRLEAAFSQQPNFQYILTTTTPPPQRMRKGSAWLREELNSSDKKNRLLCENV